MERRPGRIHERRERAIERQVLETEEQADLEAGKLEAITAIIISGMGNLSKIIYRL